jgi:hypothetical protein
MAKSYSEFVPNPIEEKTKKALTDIPEGALQSAIGALGSVVTGVGKHGLYGLQKIAGTLTGMRPTQAMKAESDLNKSKEFMERGRSKFSGGVDVLRKAAGESMGLEAIPKAQLAPAPTQVQAPPSVTQQTAQAITPTQEKPFPPNTVEQAKPKYAPEIETREAPTVDLSEKGAYGAVVNGGVTELRGYGTQPGPQDQKQQFINEQMKLMTDPNMKKSVSQHAAGLLQQALFGQDEAYKAAELGLRKESMAEQRLQNQEERAYRQQQLKSQMDQFAQTHDMSSRENKLKMISLFAPKYKKPNELTGEVEETTDVAAFVKMYPQFADVLELNTIKDANK